MDTRLQELKRQALSGDLDAAERFQHLLAKAEGHKPTCSYIKYYLQSEADARAFAAETENYISQWPNHCGSCGGWGGKGSSYDPSPAGIGLSPGSFYEFDPCADCVEEDICPRCGQTSVYLAASQTEGDYYKCSFCGWDEISNTSGLSQDPPYPEECDCWEPDW